MKLNIAKIELKFEKIMKKEGGGYKIWFESLKVWYLAIEPMQASNNNGNSTITTFKSYGVAMHE